MSAAPEDFTPEAATSIPTDVPSVTPLTARTGLPRADVPRRRPILPWRAHRAKQVWEVRWSTDPDGKAQSVLYRQRGPAYGHADRLRAQGWPVQVAVGAIVTWSVVSR